MGDILKEAIADAKAVRETALENAKMALEEAFTPQIKSMLSAKLKEDEHEDDAEEGMHDEDMDDDEGDAEEGYHEDDEMGDDEVEVPAEDAEVDDAEEDAHEGEHDDEAEEGMHDEGEDDEEVEESNLDLEAIIKELEAELTEDEDEDEEVEESTEAVEESDEPVEESTEEIEEEYEIDEAAITEDEDEDDKEVEESNTSAIEAELKEYKEAVHFLKDKLHEVNILNAKLLFTNKLFKSYSLDNNQKLKVVETFDRAQTTREIKLVYSTLAEQFQDNGSIVTRKSIKESASTPVASTKPSKESKKVITEESQVANRFKKLAGLIK